jgi:hypothetical protein
MTDILAGMRGPVAHAPNDIVQRTARMLNCEPAAVAAVAAVEGAGVGMDEKDRPLIRYERHVFARETQQLYNRSHPHLSGRYDPKFKAGDFDHRWKILEEAATLNLSAALKATSWGMFQVMGFNHRQCGYDTVEEMVRSFAKSETNQYAGLVKFLTAANLIAALRFKNWGAFARGYNGPSYADFQYDKRLASAYAKAK